MARKRVVLSTYRDAADVRDGRRGRRAKRLVNERRDLLAEIKLERGCADCGYREHAVALDFDHRPGEDKSFQISVNLQRAWPIVMAEVNKCDVVCANCHRVRTATRGQAGRVPVVDKNQLSWDLGGSE